MPPGGTFILSSDAPSNVMDSAMKKNMVLSFLKENPINRSSEARPGFGKPDVPSIGSYIRHAGRPQDCSLSSINDNEEYAEVQLQQTGNMLANGENCSALANSMVHQMAGKRVGIDPKQVLRAALGSEIETDLYQLTSDASMPPSGKASSRAMKQGT